MGNCPKPYREVNTRTNCAAAVSSYFERKSNNHFYAIQAGSTLKGVSQWHGYSGTLYVLTPLESAKDMSGVYIFSGIFTNLKIETGRDGDPRRKQDETYPNIKRDEKYVWAGRGFLVFFPVRWKFVLAMAWLI